jgi:cysteinyl-tRNA synthetase
MTARSAGAPEFRLYNTLTRRVEPFAPADGETVRMYSCGPTVYNPAHLGNFRSFMFYDLLRQALRLYGWNVRQVMNLTDVDDKIIKRASEQGKSIVEITQPVTEIFFVDRDYLRIKPAEDYPKATDYIPQMIALVRRLVERNVAYRAEDGSVYFAISRFPQYGKLSRLDTREVKAGARVAQDDYSKENAQDFALWKAAKAEDERTGAAWDSPWGRGRPGWHLECSAMAMDLLGETLDLHTGGIDLIFPHHEDEIAQSCAYTGKDLFARYWLHGEFLNIRGSKMSKRFGNITTPRDLREDGVDAGAVRLLMFQTHYRQKLDLTDEALAAAQEASRRLGEFQNRLEESSCDSNPPRLTEAAERLTQSMTEALDDDLNAPSAIAAMFTYMKEGNAAMDGGEDPGPIAIHAWDRAESVLGVTTPYSGMKVQGYAPTVHTEWSEVPPAEPNDELIRKWAKHWALRRKDAKSKRDYGEADRIRDFLRQAGWEVRDAKDGSVEVVPIMRAS